MTLNKVVRKLHDLGHAPEFPELDEHFFTWVMSDLGEELISRYQRSQGLPATGKLTTELAEHLLPLN